MTHKWLLLSLPIVMSGCAVSSGGGSSEAVASDMVEISAGVAIIGTVDETNYDAPMKSVNIPAFKIDKTEVTNSQYRACVDAGSCTEPALYGWDQIPDYYNDSEYDNYPVVFVDWFQANAYCRWQDKRLPLEAEWEKAARGTDGLTYPWGDGAPSCDVAQFNDCNAERGFSGPLEAGSLAGNVSPFGVHDMGGNVAEWTADWYDTDIYYDFVDGELPVRALGGRSKSIRGGSWWCEAERLPAHKREAMSPFYRSGNTGFRCAQSL